MSDFLKVIKGRNYFKEMYDIFNEVNEFRDLYKTQIDIYNKDKEKIEMKKEMNLILLNIMTGIIIYL